jgi:hypothetical protein
MPALTDVDSYQEQLLEAIKTWQTAAVAAAREAAALVPPTFASVPDVPPLDGFLAPQEQIEAHFAFAEKLLKNQRDFATELASIWTEQPAAAKKSTPKS